MELLPDRAKVRFDPLHGGYIFTNWPPRKEALEVCADRLAKCLNRLKQDGPLFSSWLDARTKGRLKINTDPRFLAQLLEAGRQKTDSPPRRIIEELGYTIRLTTDDTREQSSFHLNCGNCSKRVLNSCCIEYPEAGSVADKVIGFELRVKALRILVEAWDPDWGAICSWEVQRLMQSYGVLPRFPGYIGSVTYLSYRCGELPEEMRQKFRIEEVSSFGNLIYPTRESLEETSVDHVKALAELYQILEKMGVYYKFPVKI